MGFSAPKPPQVQMPPPSAYPAVLGSSLDEVKQRSKAAEGLGMDNTVKTSPQGLQTPPETAKATLLGK